MLIILKYFFILLYIDDFGNHLFFMILSSYNIKEKIKINPKQIIINEI